MKIGILYTSASGNTKLLADAIAIQMNCPIFDVHTLTEDEKTTFWKTNQFDLLFIGSGIYSAHVGIELRNFLIRYPPPKGLTVALFGTWAGWNDSGSQTFVKLMNYLEKTGVNIMEETYLAFGKMGMAKIGHPDTAEIQNAGYWANRILKSMKE